MAHRIEIRFGGGGGQGVVLASKILGEAAALDGKSALQTQAYGAEARGSLAKGEVIISDSKIGFPAVRKSDILVAMNQESLNALLKDLKEEGALIVDSGMVKAIPDTRARIVKLPITETAKTSFGEAFYANMVMLGALTRITRVVSEESMEASIRESVPGKTVAVNVEAFRRGLQLRDSQA